MVVGPTKVQPRLRRSFDSATETGVVGIAFRTGQVNVVGRSAAAGSQLHAYAASDPNSSPSSSMRRALLMVEAILPRWRTMPGSFNSRATSRAP